MHALRDTKLYIYVKETFGDVGYVEPVEALLNHVGPELLKGNVKAFVDVGRLNFVLAENKTFGETCEFCSVLN